MFSGQYFTDYGSSTRVLKLYFERKKIISQLKSSGKNSSLSASHANGNWRSGKINFDGNATPPKSLSQGRI